jgi:hypothetical protein
MKLRFLLAVIGLLLLGSVANAAPAPQAATPAAPAAADLSFMTPAASSPSAPGCAAPELSFLNPAPTDRVSTCGTCSPTICRGHQTGSSCGIGKWCQVSDSCSSGGWTCYCGAAA